MIAWLSQLSTNSMIFTIKDEADDDVLGNVFVTFIFFTSSLAFSILVIT